MKQRILVCGSRTYGEERFEYWIIRTILDELLRHWRDHNSEKMVIIEGGAKGADSVAFDWARDEHLRVEHLSFPADWDTHGKAAGPIRNQRMLDEGKPDVVLAFSSNLKDFKGTKDMIARAIKAGVEVRIIETTSIIPEVDE